MITEVCHSFAGNGRRDGVISQRVRSPSVMKCYKTKKSLVLLELKLTTFIYVSGFNNVRLNCLYCKCLNHLMFADDICVFAPTLSGCNVC